MSKNYTVMELEAIKHLCKCVNSVASLPADLIADTNVATNTTYSSYKIDAEMSALENDIQRYVDTALAGLNKLSKEVIDDKALVVKENVLYLYKDPLGTSNDYMQMMLINGVVVELGSTTCDMNGYYTNAEIDDKFALKIDLDVLTTSFNNFATAIDEKVDKTEMKEITEQDILSKLGLSTTDIETMNKILDDAVVTTTKTFSSSKIYADIQQCLQDSKDFTLREIANKVGASYKIVTNVVDMTSKDHLYLMNNGGVYDIYIVDDTNAPVKIGDTNIDLSGYVKVTDLEKDFLKKADAVLEYATITAVDGKVDKDKIVTVLDNTVTDEQVPSAKGVWNIASKGGLDWSSSTITLINENDDLNSYTEAGTYRCKSKTISSTLSNSPINNSAFKMEVTTGASDFLTQYILVSNNANFKPLMRTKNSQGLWGAWQRVCTTKVEDVAKTVYSLDTSCDGVYKKGDTNTDNCWYAIRNGWCIVQIDLKCLQVGAGFKHVFTSLPKPIASVANVIMTNDKKIDEGDKPLIVIVGTDGTMKVEGGKLDGRYIGTFSYPVAE